MRTMRTIERAPVAELLGRFGLELLKIESDHPIPGSFWGAPEAGLINNQLFVCAETPLHSILHEACHYICMDDERRQALHTNAGGNYAEEDAVCYLQILLAGFLSDTSAHELCQEMDAWGYTFRLGSAWAWFENDAEDAYCWLLEKAIITIDGQLTWQLARYLSK